MLPVQPYRPGGYPPNGPRWVQFGDDLLGGALSARDEARAKLAGKRESMQVFHIQRLQQDGFMPLGPAPSQHPAGPPDPETEATAQYDRFVPDAEMAWSDSP